MIGETVPGAYIVAGACLAAAAAITAITIYRDLRGYWPWSWQAAEARRLTRLTRDLKALHRDIGKWKPTDEWTGPQERGTENGGERL